MPVKMQVRPGKDDAVDTLEARAAIQMTLTSQENVTSCKPD